MIRTGETCVRVVVTATIAVSLSLVLRASNTVNLVGQIMAYRVADQLLQRASFVENRETYLLKLNPSHSKQDGDVVKIVYTHLGQSDLDIGALNSTPTVRIDARRQPSCDQTFGELVEQAPVFKDQNGENPTEKLAFFGRFEEQKPSPSTKLKCYTVKSGAFHFSTSEPNKGSN